MFNPRHLRNRFLLPVLLAVVLFATRHFWSQAQAVSLDNLVATNSLTVDQDSLSPEHPGVMEAIAKNNRIPKVVYNYQIIAKDIVQIFKWLDEPDITPLKIVDKMHSIDRNCKYPFDSNSYSCREIVIDRNSRHQASLTGLSGKLSDDYAYYVSMWPAGYDDSIQIEIGLVPSDRLSFSIDKLRKALLPEQQFSAHNRVCEHCDGKCPDPTCKWEYSLNLRNKYFPDAPKNQLYKVGIVGKGYYYSKEFIAYNIHMIIRFPEPR